MEDIEIEQTSENHNISEETQQQTNAINPDAHHVTNGTHNVVDSHEWRQFLKPESRDFMIRKLSSTRTTLVMAPPDVESQKTECQAYLSAKSIYEYYYFLGVTMEKIEKQKKTRIEKKQTEGPTYSPPKLSPEDEKIEREWYGFIPEALRIQVREQLRSAICPIIAVRYDFNDFRLFSYVKKLEYKIRLAAHSRTDYLRSIVDEIENLEGKMKEIRKKLGESKLFPDPDVVLEELLKRRQTPSYGPKYSVSEMWPYGSDQGYKVLRFVPKDAEVAKAGSWPKDYKITDKCVIEDLEELVRCLHEGYDLVEEEYVGPRAQSVMFMPN